MKKYIKPEIEIIDLETATSILAASGVANDGNSIDTSGDFEPVDASEYGAAKGNTIWD